MSDERHIRECKYQTGPCICSLLERYGARVRAKTANRIMSLRYNEVQGWSEMKQAMAYKAGLDAAREAVEAAWIHASEALDPLDPRTFTDILAAIDALREEQK